MCPSFWSSILITLLPAFPCPPILSLFMFMSAIVLTSLMSLSLCSSHFVPLPIPVSVLLSLSLFPSLCVRLSISLTASAPPSLFHPQTYLFSALARWLLESPSPGRRTYSLINWSGKGKRSRRINAQKTEPVYERTPESPLPMKPSVSLVTRRRPSSTRDNWKAPLTPLGTGTW